MACLQTKNPNFGKFWRVLQWKILRYFMTVWSILRPLEIFYGHLVYFVVIWYIFPVLVFCTKKNLATLIPLKYKNPESAFIRTAVCIFLNYFFCPGDNILARFDNIAHVPQVQHQLLPSLEQACRRVCAAPGRSGFCMIRKQEVPETS
jgi:hypothetical protein